MSNKKNNPMRYSRHVHKFSYYKKTNSDLDWINNINKETNKYNIDVIMPIFEDGIKTIIKYKQLISSSNKLGVLPSLDNFNSAINKGLLIKHLEQNEIPYPKSILIESGKNYNVNLVAFPIIIKPLEGFGGGMGIYVFENKKELEQYLITNRDSYTFLVQDYIKGYDIDCSVLCKDGEILAFTIQKGTMFGKSEFAPQIGLQFLYEQELYKIVEKLMKSLNWSGVAHIDLRYDENDKQFKVIEVNTRFWVSLDASLIAGVNFPYLYCLASLGENFQKPSYKNIKYLNLKGLINRIKKNKRFILHTEFVFNNTPIKFALKDPLPMVYKFISRTKNILISKFKR
ncbi:ATP-grasp domain-containing protein [Flavobacteriaceae bacterium AH-315-B10]|nr:ATP-grasp domain-containing protein [Flavobacteriaceae bacterium AH-315-B10]